MALMMQALTDDFATQDAAKWTYVTNTAASGGRFVATPTTAYPTATSATTYDLTGSYLCAEVTQVTNAGNSTITGFIGATPNTAGTNDYRFSYDGFGLLAQYIVGGAQNNLNYSSSYSAVNERWLRIRESGGTIYWETSPTGLTWTVHSSAAAQFASTALTAFIGAGFYGTEPTPGTWQVDNFNLPPGPAGPVTHVATSTPAAAGTTTSASTVSITPTLPTGSASGDRVYVIQAGNNTAGTTPTSWTAATKDVQVGPTGTAPGAGTGRRYLSVYYRDYDGAWSMPAFTLTSATQNTHALSAITLRKAPADTWDTPNVSTAGNTSSASTSYSVVTGSVTAASGMVLEGTATNDNVTASAESLTSSAMTFTGLAERSDTGSATGNDVSIKSYTADVSSGATGTVTHAVTLSGASEGGSVVVAQSATAVYVPPAVTVVTQAALVRANSW